MSRKTSTSCLHFAPSSSDPPLRAISVPAGEVASEVHIWKARTATDALISIFFRLRYPRVDRLNPTSAVCDLRARKGPKCAHSLPDSDTGYCIVWPLHPGVDGQRCLGSRQQVSLRRAASIATGRSNQLSIRDGPRHEGFEMCATQEQLYMDPSNCERTKLRRTFG